LTLGCNCKAVTYRYIYIYKVNQAILYYGVCGWLLQVCFFVESIILCYNSTFIGLHGNMCWMLSFYLDCLYQNLWVTLGGVSSRCFFLDRNGSTVQKYSEQFEFKLQDWVKYTTYAMINIQPPLLHWQGFLVSLDWSWLLILCCSRVIFILF
jgi:hypothetical protein